MRIAVPYDRGRIDPHFGHCASMVVFDTDDEKILGKMTIPCQGSGHEYMTSLLKKLKVEVVICGNMGKPAIQRLREANIRIYMGLSGSPENSIIAFLEGSLESFNTAKLDLSLMEDDCNCGH
ncbi:putative Fe-Mo cluster-binding NifX family protein [Anaeroplasma bactoclasticum]|jgi:predicted Fe-Mo cluster-binding NifX family protein|uniref:Putative Fe-Mo cluster-binding NifX family protein n=1 Tax=Anaeroplasma bactoclasticum TaxID=2088 RepID=A0A397S6N3_9MOLU|nr:NifB/NifX family molybdenum-iron cluster-binding protein [Anaeroplasma bactoclasticum]RIA78391.1 putative Fe-Mo cluster-binding NifX family protein [Anaeroplasma bactoclasticum]